LAVFGQKLAFFYKNNVMVNFLHNLAFLVKNAYIFAKIFRQKYIF
jgi:hypothetical protein